MAGLDGRGNPVVDFQDRRLCPVLGELLPISLWSLSSF
jgi:hypothetical protein